MLMLSVRIINPRLYQEADLVPIHTRIFFLRTRLPSTRERFIRAPKPGIFENGL